MLHILVVSKEIIGIFFKSQSAARTSSQLKNDYSLIIKENRVKSIENFL